MVAKKKVSTVIKTEVTLGQLIGVALSLLILIATSYVNLEIKVSQNDIRQTNTDNSVTEIKGDIKDIKAAQNIILQKLGALDARVEYQQKEK